MKKVKKQVSIMKRHFPDKLHYHISWDTCSCIGTWTKRAEIRTHSLPDAGCLAFAPPGRLFAMITCPASLLRTG